MADYTQIGEVKRGDKAAIRYSFTKKQILITSVLLVLAISVLMIVKALQVRSIKSNFLSLEQNLKQEASARFENTEREFLRLIAEPYAWAIRSAMKQGNIHEIDSYLNAMVRSGSFSSVMVVNKRGTVISATTDGYVGKYYISFGSPYFVNVDSTIVYEVHEGLLTTASPIMDGNEKIGTLIIHYVTKSNDVFLDQ
jgi:hypothetical protein